LLRKSKRAAVTCFQQGLYSKAKERVFVHNLLNQAVAIWQQLTVLPKGFAPKERQAVWSRDLQAN